MRAGALCRGKPNGTYRNWRATASLVVKSMNSVFLPMAANGMYNQWALDLEKYY